MISNRAVTDHPVLDVVAERWSPYAFDPRPVEREKLLACLEAARWSASSYNEQPWRFLIACREDPAAFDQMLDCLVPGNQSWAAQAGVLMLTVASRFFSHNGKPNRVAVHDIGLAMGNLCCQATQLQLAVHQMAGIEIDKIRQVYAIPEGFDPVTGVALGYAAPADQAPTPQLAERDRAPRTRKPLSEFVFSGSWQQTARIVK